MSAELPADAREAVVRLVVTIFRTLNQNHRGGGRDDAVRIIISALARIDPATALRQADWLLNGDGARRGDVMAGLVLGQLVSTDADTVADTLTMVTRLMLPIDLHTSLDFGKAITAVSAGRLATDPRVSAALETIRAIARTRVQDRSMFDGLLRVEWEEKATGTGENDGSLVKSDGAVLTQAKVVRLAADPGVPPASRSRP